MAKLKRQESFVGGVRRIIVEAMDDMCRPPEGEDVVHDLRVACKKIRAYLRLLRRAMGEDAFRRENVVFRDLARRLGGRRDAKVLTITFTGLEAAFPRAMSPADIAAVRSALPPSSPAGDLGEIIADAHLTALVARSRLSALAVDDARGTGALQHAFHRMCLRNRRALSLAARAPSAGNLHEWRKQAKALWYQLRLARDFWPRKLKKLDTRFEALTTTLGDYHDLAMLERHLATTAALAQPIWSVHDLIQTRCRVLQAQAFHQAKFLFRLSAPHFAKRLAAHRMR